jgi:type II secretory pathway pseudopilin PulG
MVRRMSKGDDGFALAAVLLAILLLSIGLALVAASLQLRMRLVRREAQSVTLTALSDAALAETLAELGEDAYYHGVPEHGLGPGRLRSEVRFLSPGRYEVVATATYAGRERTVEAEVLRPTGAPPRVLSWRRR